MELTNLKEMMLINEAGVGFFNEAKNYSDSSEFTDEFYDLHAQVVKMKKIMKNPKWLEYMKATDRNMSTEVEQPARDALRAITDLEVALTEIDREFDMANGNEGVGIDGLIDPDSPDADELAQKLKDRRGN